MILPVLLAGGEGKRLWPLSTTKTPKQFLSVIPNYLSFYQATIERTVYCAPSSAIITVTNTTLAWQAKRQFRPFASKCDHHIVQEPYGRNTAAATGLAALYAQEQFGKETILWVVPADHSIQRWDRLKHALALAIPYAVNGMIVTFGVTPTWPDPNYGYIVAKGREDVLDVTQFIEKPSLDIIYSLPQDKTCYWNSGMFVFSAATILSEMACYEGRVLEQLEQAYQQAVASITGICVHSTSYEALPSLPLDKVIMERSDRLKTIPIEIGWQDIGSWQSLWEFTKGSRYDRINSPQKEIDGVCSNCIAYLNKRFAFNEF